MKSRSFKIPCLRPVRLTNRLDLTDPAVSPKRKPAFGLIIRSAEGTLRRRQALASLAGLVLMASLGSCGSSASSGIATNLTNDYRPSNLLSTAAIDTAHVETTRNELNLTGKITFNEDQVVTVFSQVAGRIETVKAEPGDYVQQGDTLAIIRSGHLTASGQSSQSDLAAGPKRLQAAKSEVDQGYRQVLGGDGSVYVIKAPRSGFIVEKTASRGMELRSNNTESLFKISNPDQVWVLADINESDLTNVRVGDPATITTLSYPDKLFNGRIDRIVNILDPASKTIKVRVTLDNANDGSGAYPLKPAMSANVSVTYADNDRRVAIPSVAVVFDRNRNFVVTVTKDHLPEVREIDIHKTIRQTTYLADGLSAGDCVVVTNQLSIYNALEN